jgi:hypothetical protein
VGGAQMMVTNLGWYDADYTTSPRSVKVIITQNVSGNNTTFTINQSEMPDQYGGSLFYQWGRKDPFPGLNGDWSERVTSGWSVSASKSTIANAIQHPNVFYAHEYLWCSDEKNDKLWNIDGIANTDVAVRKTIYDPCPVGYKMPRRSAFGFTGTTGSFNRGWALTPPSDGIFFPATFLREFNGGAPFSRINGTGSYEGMAYIGGYYWTACSGTDQGWGGVYLEFRDHASLGNPLISPTQDKGPIGYGFAVRCVKE